MIRALLVPTDREPRFVEIEPRLEVIREQIGGGWLEAVAGDARDGGWTAYGDEEGRLKGLPVNEAASHMLGQVIVGPVLFVGLRQSEDPEEGLMEADFEPPTTCSWCEDTAAYVGAGQDGDFYCERHKGKAPGGLLPA